MGDERSQDDEFLAALILPDAALLPLAESILEGAGIRFFAKNELTQNLFGYGQLGAGYNFIIGPPVLMVEASRVQEARELLDPLLSEQTAAAPERD